MINFQLRRLNKTKHHKALLLEWCLPENSSIIDFTVLGKRIEINFMLNGTPRYFETNFPGWDWIEKDLRARKHIKETLLRGVIE